MYAIQVYEDVRGEWRWRLVATNGRVVADSAEGYVREDYAHEIADSIFAGAERVARIRETD